MQFSEKQKNAKHSKSLAHQFSGDPVTKKLNDFYDIFTFFDLRVIEAEILSGFHKIGQLFLKRHLKMHQNAYDYHYTVVKRDMVGISFEAK